MKIRNRDIAFLSIGMIIGVSILLVSATTSIALEVKSMIGKVVDGQFQVVVDGNKLDKYAITINGTSYLPVRSFGESVGYEVLFNPDGEIILNNRETMKKISESETEASDQLLNDAAVENDELKINNEKWFNDQKKKSEINISLEVKREQLNRAKEDLLDFENKFELYRVKFENFKSEDQTIESTENYRIYVDKISELKKTVDKLSSEIEGLEEKLIEIEVNQ